jgi:hypothetical protein
MSTVVVNPPFPRFDDLDGQPLENGIVWVGVANMDAPSNPIAVFWDAALTIAAAQPIRTVNGYLSRDGSPGVLFAGSDYSIKVTTAVGVPVYSAPARVDTAVTDVVISSGESLIVESGGTIDVLDGGVVNVGDASGVGVLVNMASNARVVGNVVPNTDGVQTLGIVTRRWDAFLGEVQVLGNITPPTGLPGDLNVGSNTLPLGNMVSQTVRADDLTVYRTAQPSSITDYAGLAKLNARTTVLALVRQTSSTSTAAFEAGEAYNIAFVTYNAGPNTYTVQFTTNVPLNAIPIVCSQQTGVPNAVVEIDSGGGGYTATVYMSNTAFTATSGKFSLVVYGSPSATGAAGIVSPIL